MISAALQWHNICTSTSVYLLNKDRKMNIKNLFFFFSVRYILLLSACVFSHCCCYSLKYSVVYVYIWLYSSLSYQVITQVQRVRRSKETRAIIQQRSFRVKQRRSLLKKGYFLQLQSDISDKLVKQKLYENQPQSKKNEAVNYA